MPCLDDNGFILWDSHVIIAYLINKYVENDTPLYPKDLKIRSKINQRNHFDTGVLFAKLRELIVSKISFKAENTLATQKLGFLIPIKYRVYFFSKYLQIQFCIRIIQRSGQIMA